MRKTSLFILLLLRGGVLSAQTTINDTLFFAREKNDSFYHRVFLDTNPRSKFYSRVSDFTFNRENSRTYKQSLKYLYRKKLFSKKQPLNTVPREWVMLETYKGKTYVYSPCDFYFHYKVKITDSTFIDWTGEGPEANFIRKFSKTDPLSYTLLLQSQSFPDRELTIKYLDKEKGIAIFRMKFFNKNSNKTEKIYQLMIDVKKMREIPLLVNQCDYQKQTELDFDKIDYSVKFQPAN